MRISENTRVRFFRMASETFPPKRVLPSMELAKTRRAKDEGARSHIRHARHYKAKRIKGWISAAAPTAPDCMVVSGQRAQQRLPLLQSLVRGHPCPWWQVVFASTLASQQPGREVSRHLMLCVIGMPCIMSCHVSYYVSCVIVYVICRIMCHVSYYVSCVILCVMCHIMCHVSYYVSCVMSRAT